MRREKHTEQLVEGLQPELVHYYKRDERGQQKELRKQEPQSFRENEVSGCPGSQRKCCIQEGVNEGRLHCYCHCHVFATECSQ